MTVLLLLLAGCSSSSTQQKAAPKSDEDQLYALYDEFRAALKSRDTDAFLAVMCPGVRPRLKPAEWFKDADKLGDIKSIEAFTPPDGGKDAPNASEWRRLLFEPAGRLRVAKIDGTWFACET
jgi:hypothetical protein